MGDNGWAALLTIEARTAVGHTMVMRALLLGVIVFIGLGAMADGEAGPRRWQTRRQPEAQARLAQASPSALTFDIPGQALADALTAFVDANISEHRAARRRVMQPKNHSLQRSSEIT
jgi:hypothetical protein